MIQHKENWHLVNWFTKSIITKQLSFNCLVSRNAIDLEQNMSDTKWLYFCEQKKSTSITVESLSSGRSCSQVQTT